MKEHGLLFSAEMVRAFLSGSKSQTRRPVAKANSIGLRETHDLGRAFVDKGPSPAGNLGPYLHAPRPIQGDEVWDRIYCRYAVGDRIWVKEKYGSDSEQPGKLFYEASYSGPATVRWVSSMLMPRRIARIILEIVQIQCQRIQDITEEDAKAEGVRLGLEENLAAGALEDLAGIKASPARLSFGELWDSLNSDRGYSWRSNPWVWVLTFKRME